MSSFMDKFRSHGTEPRDTYSAGIEYESHRHNARLPMSFDPPPRSDVEFAPRHARTRQLGEAAARAAQYVDDLESEVGQLKAEAATLRSHINVLEESNEIIKEEAEALRRDNERLTRENTAIATRVQMAAEILLVLRKPVVLPPPPTQEPSHDQEDTTSIDEATIEKAKAFVERSIGGEAGHEDQKPPVGS